MLETPFMCIFKSRKENPEKKEAIKFGPCGVRNLCNMLRICMEVSLGFLFDR